jgi:hypothetical protein
VKRLNGITLTMGTSLLTPIHACASEVFAEHEPLWQLNTRQVAPILLVFSEQLELLWIPRP